LDFATAAAQFCSVVERADVSQRGQWLADIEVALAELYAAAVRLPPFGDEDVLTTSRMSTDEWAGLFSSLRAKIGSEDAYSFADPTGESTMICSIADDLAEIYQEVRQGLDAIHSGEPPEAILSAWELGFEIHWGAHAIGALAALRSLMRPDD